MQPGSTNWKLGLSLALVTTGMWGVLPIALSSLMGALDPVTVTFIRFGLAAAALTPYLAIKQRLPDLISLKSPLLWAAGLFLSGNYIFYILGLEKTTPEAAQVMIQLAPMLLLLSGVWIFGERFSSIQWIGTGLFSIGLLLFFHHRLETIATAAGEYGPGIWLIVLAALLWTGYGILQKVLLRHHSSEQTMVVIYWIGALIFLPWSDLSPITGLSGTQWAILVFCGANTLIAYGAFAEALQHWEASRVSATVTLAPLITVLVVQLIPMKNIAAEPVTALSLIGALLVVAGSMLAALANSSR